MINGGLCALYCTLFGGLQQCLYSWAFRCSLHWASPISMQAIRFDCLQLDPHAHAHTPRGGEILANWESRICYHTSSPSFTNNRSNSTCSRRPSKAKPTSGNSQRRRRRNLCQLGTNAINLKAIIPFRSHFFYIWWWGCSSWSLGHVSCRASPPKMFYLLWHTRMQVKFQLRLCRWLCNLFAKTCGRVGLHLVVVQLLYL